MNQIKLKTLHEHRVESQVFNFQVDFQVIYFLNRKQ